MSSCRWPQGLLVALILFALPAAADEPYVPPDLEPWRQWVLHDHPTLGCPLGSANGDSRSCVWPGRFDLSVNPRGATFEQRVDSRIEQHYALPYATHHRPLDVRIDDRAVPVAYRNGRPHVRLPAGDLRLTGRFAWDVRPAAITLPPSTGRVSLQLDGRRVERPRWSADTLYLGQTANRATPTSENRIDLAVYRVLADGAPPTMRVTLQLDVAGTRREVTLGKVLPAGFEPASLASPLPARLDSDGQLNLQVSPGQWFIELGARTVPPLTSVTFERNGSYWPEEEVWSYRDAPRLRVTEPDGLTPVDPAQVGVPPRDRALPAFLLRAGDTLSVTERQRGYAQDARNELTLRRQMWLAFDRDNFVVRDQLTGLIRRDWRLDLAEPLVLESARSQGENLLVTRSSKDGLRGIEVRQPRVALDAVSNTTQVTGAFPVAGWQTTISGVTTTVHLPPGERLLTALNVDRSRGDWASRWTLLDFFLVLVVAAAFWRLQAPWLGATALVALVLTLHEPGAPAWSWLFLIAAVGAAGAMPAGRLRTSARVVAGLAVAAFALQAVPFFAQQIKWALYPQLENQFRASFLDVSSQFDGAAMDMAVEEAAPAAAPAVQRKEIKRDRLESAPPVTSRALSTGRRVVNRYASDVQVQAGPGLPAWSGQRHTLEWFGPVASDQTFRLVVLPGWAVRLWRVLGVVLSVLAAVALLARHARAILPPRDDTASGPGASTAVAGLVGALIVTTLTGTAPTAQADPPSTALLDELEQRLTARPACAPQCASVERAEVSVEGGALRMRLIVHTQDSVAVGLPGDPASWYPQLASVDGAPRDTLAYVGETFRLVLTPGVHRIVLGGTLPAASAVTIAFPLAPGDIVVDSPGWDASGLSDRRLPGGALTLTRVSEAAPTGEQDSFDAMDAERFPAFVTVERRLSFGLDWTVRTTVRRVTPPTAAINLSLPLLPDEAVGREDLSVLNGIASVALAPGQSETSWTSTLTRTSPVVLTAATDAPWQEVWEVEPGPNWRLTHRGVPADNADPVESPSWLTRFTPWSGETLTLDVTRPEPVSGPTLAIDGVSLSKTLGRRGAESQLEFRYRATQGGQHTLTLPAGADLSRLEQDGRALARGLDGGALTIPILPGEHRVAIAWRSSDASAWRVRGDDVDMGLAAANVSTTLGVTRDRWILWTQGPSQGPAVLYWSELLVLVLVAVALGRLVSTPLGVRAWILLGLGFSTFFWPSLAALVVTVLAFRWRERVTLSSATWFNTAQIGLAILFGLSAMALLTTIPFGLLGSPDMHIVGNGSYGTALKWFTDHIDGTLPDVAVLSLPLWMYKALILLWSLWLALAVLRWLPWMWRAWTKDGHWRRGVRSRGATSPPPGPPAQHPVDRSGETA